MSLEKKREFILQLCQYGEAIKTDKEITEKVISARLQFIPRKKLYKFRPCEERHFQLLDENCIWMPPADSFVDLFDSTINIDLLKNSNSITKAKIMNMNMSDVFRLKMQEIASKVFPLSMPYMSAIISPLII